MVPTATFPKAKLPGLGTRFALLATPLAESEITWGESGAVSVTVMFPATPPPVLGENFTLNDRLWPAVTVAGNDSPLTVKALPESVTRFTTTFTFPLFVSLTVCVLL